MRTTNALMITASYYHTPLPNKIIKVKNNNNALQSKDSGTAWLGERQLGLVSVINTLTVCDTGLN